MSARYAHEPLVVVCEDESAAAEGLHSLVAQGVDAKRISLLGRPRMAMGQGGGIYTIGGQLKLGGALPSPWREAWKQLSSPAVFLLPTLGLIAAAGPFTLSIAAGLRGAEHGEGDSPMALAFWSIGASRDQAADYESALADDHLLLLVQDTNDAVERARNILAAMQPGIRSMARLASC